MKVRPRASEAPTDESVLPRGVWGLLVAVGLGVPMSASAQSASATVCEPARIAEGQPDLPKAWRTELELLAFSATGTGQPWDCSGAELSLSLTDHGGELSVRLPDGRVARRPIKAPDLVVPVGEALLAQPESALAAPSKVDAEATAKNPVVPAARPAPSTPRDEAKPLAARAPDGPSDLRLLIDASAVTRLSAAVNAVWVGGSLRVTVPFSDWSGAAWARIDVPAHELEHVSPFFTMNEICVGTAVGYRLLRKPFELRVSGDASFGVVSMDSGNERQERGESGEGSKADFRLGADFQGAVPFGRIGRFVVGTDFEITPARFGGRRTISDSLPELPGFSAGLSLGLGVGVP